MNTSARCDSLSRTILPNAGAAARAPPAPSSRSSSRRLSALPHAGSVLFMISALDMPDGFQTLSVPYRSETRFVCDSSSLDNDRPHLQTQPVIAQEQRRLRSGPILPILRENWHYFERIRLAGWN